MNHNSKFSVRDICYAGLFAAVIAVMAQISIPMPLGVPMTMQTFAITLAAVVLGSKLSAIATLVYLLLGAVGVPVLANFSGGIGKLIGPTGGYLFSYPLTALAVALSVKLFKKRSVLSLSVGMTVGCLLSYTCGTLYYMAIGGVSLGAALASCVVPFIWFDVLKIVFCTALGTLVGRRMEKNI